MNSSTTKQLRKAKFSQDTLVIPMGDHLILNLRSTFPPPPPPKLSENTPIYQIKLNIYESFLDKKRIIWAKFLQYTEILPVGDLFISNLPFNYFSPPPSSKPCENTPNLPKKLYIHEFLKGAVWKT